MRLRNKIDSQQHIFVFLTPNVWMFIQLCSYQKFLFIYFHYHLSISHISTLIDTSTNSNSQVYNLLELWAQITCCVCMEYKKREMGDPWYIRKDNYLRLYETFWVKQKTKRTISYNWGVTQTTRSTVVFNITNFEFLWCINLIL